jgi:excisionase family DNA binding protein
LAVAESEGASEKVDGEKMGNQMNSKIHQEDALLIPADQLAALIQVSTRTLWRLLSAGRLPKPVRIGGSVRWRMDQVKQWIESGCPPQEE